MPVKKPPKTFVLDTNVILHDPTCISHFQENNIVIPLVVIEEMDHFKRGNQVINLNAREFARTLDSLTGNALFDGGIPLGKKKGKIKKGEHIHLLKMINLFHLKPLKENHALKSFLLIHLCSFHNR